MSEYDGVHEPENDVCVGVRECEGIGGIESMEKINSAAAAAARKSWTRD